VASKAPSRNQGHSGGGPPWSSRRSALAVAVDESGTRIRKPASDARRRLLAGGRLAVEFSDAARPPRLPTRWSRASRLASPTPPETTARRRETSQDTRAERALGGRVGNCGRTSALQPLFEGGASNGRGSVAIEHTAGAGDPAPSAAAGRAQCRSLNWPEEAADGSRRRPELRSAGGRAPLAMVGQWDPAGAHRPEVRESAGRLYVASSRRTPAQRSYIS
jgi:hypothetical protein